MKMVRITTKQKPVLKYLEDAWEAPDEQDILTEDIMKWLRANIHRADVGLWVALDEGNIVGCLLAFGPSLLLPGVHIYTAWLKKDCGINAKEFFEGDFVDWARSLGADEITMCSCGHAGRAWQRKYGFQRYSTMYRRSLVAKDHVFGNLNALKELQNGRR